MQAAGRRPRLRRIVQRDHASVTCRLGSNNVWLGTTTENQEEADRRIPHLILVAARVRFLSCEPLLGPISLKPDWLDGSLHWVIAGRESRPNARLAKIKGRETDLYLIDQRTFECKWNTLVRLARHKPKDQNKIELFYFLAASWLPRALAAQRDHTAITDWWGRDDWQSSVG